MNVSLKTDSAKSANQTINENQKQCQYTMMNVIIWTDSKMLVN